MKKYFIGSLLFFFLGYCEKESDSDKYPPLDDQEWFRNLISPCEEDAICKLRVNQALYDSDTVYYSTRIGALCDIVFDISLLTVDGDTVKNYFGPYEIESFDNEVTLIKTIYRCED